MEAHTVASDRCPREADTIRAAWSEGTSASPGPRLDQPLVDHIADCQTCAEIAALATTFREERDVAFANARPPAAGVIWWRAERRAREEAARKAASPVSFVHAIAIGCAAAALVAILGLGLDSVPANLIGWWRSLAWPGPPVDAMVAALSTLPLGVLVLMATTLLLAPIALYFAISE